MQNVIITGAGSGIGKELTRLFLLNGDRVLAVSLLKEELDTLQAELDPEEKQITTLTMDLCKPESASAVYNHCKDIDFEADILINNAGFACFGDVTDENWEKLSNMLDLNIRAVTHLSMLFGQQMKTKGSGSILNVGSTAGMIPAARFAAYGATKAYVNNFSFALRAELKPYGVNVSCLTPAPVATNFAKAAAIDKFQGKSILKAMFDKGTVSTAEEVALTAFRQLQKGRAQILTGKGAWLAKLMFHLFGQSQIPFILKNT